MFLQSCICQALTNMSLTFHCVLEVSTAHTNRLIAHKLISCKDIRYACVNMPLVLCVFSSPQTPSMLKARVSSVLQVDAVIASDDATDVEGIRAEAKRTKTYIEVGQLFHHKYRSF